jgi:hypothetical protein
MSTISQGEKPNFTLMFGVAAGFLVFVLVIMLSQIYVMTRYKDMHPLRQHSPRLMIISSIGKLFLSVLLLLQTLIYSGCNLSIDHCPGYCGEKWVSKMCCIMGYVTLVVFEPMAVFPYFARTLRIYKIFKAQQYYFEQKRKPSEDPSFRWIKEQTMIKASAYVVLVFLV